MRTMSRRTATVATLAVLLTPLTACTSSESAAPEPDSSRTNVRPEEPSATFGHPFTSDPTLLYPQLISFTSWNRLGDNKISIFFQTGNPECHGVEAVATETVASILVALRSGIRADAVDKMCTMNAVFGTLDITLDAPVRNRQVIDAKSD
ncbi:hypothetical protein [Nocardia sp. NPDC058705]|uniref:hypothetical protein n=1 Tax=Nocardia sp. NPDC058705 TaxID=3346609 RepID=UPI0036816772